MKPSNQFVYFVEHTAGAAMLSNAAIAAAGLSYAMEGCSIQQRGTGAGPGGKAGILLAFHPPIASPAAPVFDAKTQTWINAGGYWVGIENSAPPGPEDLRRSHFVGGEPIILADGNAWEIPIARPIVSLPMLPQRCVLNADNVTWDLEPMPEHAAIYSDAAKVFAAYTTPTKNDAGETVVTFDFQESLAICVRTLSLNYRVSGPEVSLLRIVTTANRWDIMKMIADLKAFEREAAIAKTDEPAA